jgi:phosphonatase-like hydrolase
MTRLELVIFDVAGTTIQDTGQVLNAFTTALREHQIAVTMEELQKWRGASKREVLHHFIARQFGRDHPDNPALVDRAYADFCARLESSYIDSGVQTIAGVEDTFAWLREHGIKIALTTGFYRKVTDIILEGAGWSPGVIDTSVCSDQVPQGRPAPYMIFQAMEETGATDVRKVIKVGDTALDLQAGTNAGLRGVVGVLSGSQGVEKLGSETHTHIIPSVSELPRLLETAL